MIAAAVFAHKMWRISYWWVI